MKSRILKKAITSAMGVLSGLTKIIPKNRKLILIYSNLGFRDNVKAFYDFLIANGYNKTYEIVCSLNDNKEQKNTKPDNVRFVSNIGGVPTFLRAGYCFYCFGKYPIKPTKRQVVVNFWHGMPLKKIGNLESPNSVKGKYFTHVLATSELFTDIMKEALNCDQVLLAGQPRNDSLFVDEKIDIFEGYDKVIVWMPTFRRSDARGYSDGDSNNWLPIFQCIENMEGINEVLADNNALLYIKVHPLQNKIDNKGVLSNIIVHEQPDFAAMNVDLYKLLGQSSALITDYSSVYYDYMLLDKPIGFTVDDITEYGDSRGFVFDNVYDMMPGYKIKNSADFKSMVEEVIHGEDIYSTERQHMNTLCNKYIGGGYCEMIAKELGIWKD